MILNKPAHLSTLAVVTLLVLVLDNAWPSNASPAGSRILWRRQTEEREQEATTQKSEPSTPAPSSNNNAPAQQPKLYPDLSMHQPAPLPPGMVAMGGAPPMPNPFSGVHHPHHFGPTPFVPFGIQAPTTGRLREVVNEQTAPKLPPPPRPMTPADRLQSQTFANGLGRRLLSMVGINVDNNQTESAAGASASTDKQAPANEVISPMQAALQNSTVLQQLNNGIHSIYGGLSKMYNSTIQQQLAGLQEQFKRAANSTNPWVQQMSREAPKVYQSLVDRVEKAQDNLNRLWQEATNANETTLRKSASGEPPGKQRSFFDQLMGPNTGAQPGMGFFDQLGNTFGGMMPQPQPQVGGAPAPLPKPQENDLGQRLAHFWDTQVQPQVIMVRNQIGAVWNDMFRSGAITPDSVARNRAYSLNSAPSNKSAELIDDILKDASMASPEYKIEGEPDESSDSSEAKPTKDEEKRNKEEPAQTGAPGAAMSAQMQNGLINAQRELNQLWMGLSNTLRAAVDRTRGMLEPQPTFGGIQNKRNRPSEPTSAQDADPAANELDAKIEDLRAAQRDTDLVYNVVQQQQRDAERNKSFGDQFRNFFRDVNVEQTANRIGESVSKFGTVVTNFWNQVPERWDSFVQNMRHDSVPMLNRSPTSSSTTTTTSTTSTPAPSEK